ncbi:MAG TPA: TPM domain-containing protein [Candidatus Thermoplasmatota archaeon]|nr:TPM domain-containing protein [Candidatus Thermoplasmatota archaeon]
MRAPLLAAIVLLAPLAAAYPDPDAVPRYHPSPCFESHDRRFVHDFVDVVTPEYAEQIEGAACDVYLKTGAHFVLATVRDTENEALETYALHLFEAWGIGQEDRHDGLLLLFVLNHTLSGSSSAVRVEVGYGLTGVVNSVIAAESIREMRDAKARAIAGGADERDALGFALAVGSAFLIGTIGTSYVDGAFPPPPKDGPTLPFALVVFVIAVVLVALLSASARRPRRGWGYRSGSSAWSGGFAGAMAGSMMRRPPGGGGWGGGGGFGGGRSGGGGGSGGL